MHGLKSAILAIFQKSTDWLRNSFQIKTEIMMERSDYDELEPLLKSKSEAKVTTASTILQKVFRLFLLLFPGKDTKDKGAFNDCLCEHSFALF